MQYSLQANHYMYVCVVYSYLRSFVVISLSDGGLTVLSVTSVKSDKRPFLNVKK